MFQSCDSDQICTIHRIVTFEPKPFKREGIKPKPLEKKVTNPNHSKNINVISSINTQPVSGNTSETQNMTKDNVTSTVFESKDEPTQMTKQSFTIIYFITYKETIHFKLICINVHS